MDNFPLFILGLIITLISGLGVGVYCINLGYKDKQMKIAREVMKQDSECLRNLSKNNDDPTKNSEAMNLKKCRIEKK